MRPADIGDFEPVEIRRFYEARLAYDRLLYTRPIYEAGRLSGFLALQAYTEQGSKDGPSDIYPFSWEEKPKKKAGKRISPDEVERMFNREFKPIE